MGNARFELATSALSAHCSTAELISHTEDVGFEPTDILMYIGGLAIPCIKPNSANPPQRTSKSNRLTLR